MEGQGSTNRFPALGPQLRAAVTDNQQLRGVVLDWTLLQTPRLSSLGEGFWLAIELSDQACALCNRKHNNLQGVGKSSLPSGRRA